MKEFLQALSTIAAQRNYASSLAGVVAVVIALGAVDPTTAHSMVDAFQQMMDGLGQFVMGAKKLYLVAAPVVVMLCAKYAGVAASLKGRLTSIANDPDVKIEGKIIAPPEVAAAVPSNQVVAK